MYAVKPTKTIQLGQQTAVKIQWFYDETPDLSYLQTTVEEHYRSLLTCKLRRGPRKGQPYTPRGAMRLARRYAAQDAERYDAYSRKRWYMMGCVVDLEIGGKYSSSTSLWGIESDSDVSYLEQVERENVQDVLQHIASELQDRAREYTHIAADLEVDRRKLARNAERRALRKLATLQSEAR